MLTERNDAFFILMIIIPCINIFFLVVCLLCPSVPKSQIKITWLFVHITSELTPRFPPLHLNFFQRYSGLRETKTGLIS